MKSSPSYCIVHHSLNQSDSWIPFELSSRFLKFLIPSFMKYVKTTKRKTMKVVSARLGFGMLYGK